MTILGIFLKNENAFTSLLPLQQLKILLPHLNRLIDNLFGGFSFKNIRVTSPRWLLGLMSDLD